MENQIKDNNQGQIKKNKKQGQNGNDPEYIERF
jgi:hypothetical protein